MAEDERPAAPPGWYKHPAGGQRYWDGQRWADTPSPSAPAASRGLLEEKESDKVAAGCGLGCGGLVLVVGIIWVFSAIFGGGENDDDAGNEYGARSACEDWVKQQLKAPSTADFNDVEVSGSGPWTVIGSVDAENSFGARLRSRWTCEVRLDSDDYYRGRAVLLD